MILTLLFFAACFLGYTNGANDNFKGVATLFGSNTTNYKNAISWATVTTFAGSIVAIFLAGELIRNFSGKGLVPDELIQMPVFAISIALGAAATVFIATKIGMPISTTHSLVGGLFGVGLMAVGSEFDFKRLGDVFLIPLLLSPLIACVLSFGSYFLLNKARKLSGIKKSSCICVDSAIPALESTTTLNFQSGGININSCQKSSCNENYEGQILGITAQKVLDSLHFLSAGAVSFARGLNDTPKIVGLLLVINSLDVRLGLFAIGLAMAVGGLLNAKKVGITISKKITPMNSGQGFTANLITALLVSTASVNGLPVSTTHVSVGSIFGIGTFTGKADLRMILKIVLSWILTLPIAAVAGSLVFYLLQNL